MRDTLAKVRGSRIAAAALILACGLIIDARVDAGECLVQARNGQCVASCSLSAAVTECAIATGSSACLCAPSSAQQLCECFVEPQVAASSATVAFGGSRAAPERWVGAVFSGYPKLTRALAGEIDGLVAQPGTGTASLCYRGCYWVTAEGVVSWHDPGGITELGCWTPSHGGVGVPVYGNCAVS